jgi:hypothetical protein
MALSHARYKRVQRASEDATLAPFQPTADRAAAQTRRQAEIEIESAISAINDLADERDLNPQRFDNSRIIRMLFTKSQFVAIG